MDNYTKLTNLEVKKVKVTDLTDASFKVSVADVAQAAGSAPTKAEYDALAALSNDIKAKHNALLKMLQTGSST